MDKNKSRINLLKGLFLTSLPFLYGLVISFLLLSSSLLSLSGSGIFEHIMAQHQQPNMAVVVHVIFPSLISTDASTLIINKNNNSNSTIVPTQSNNFSIYNNSTYGIKFQFPFGWNKIETLAGRITLIDFTSPPSNTTGRIEVPAHVTMSIEKDLRKVTTLQQYKQASDKLLDRILGNSTTASQSATLSGLPAISRLISTKHPVSGIDISIAQVFTIKNNSAYSITYSVPSASYYRYLPVAQQY
ncbi:MAG TPA: PsbP-related protein [Nitrososphaera sp.]